MIMNKKCVVFGALTIVATVASSSAAFAQECTPRERVQAELAQALRDGTIMSGDSTGAMELEQAARHPAAPVPVDPARERQVQAELTQALRDGTIISGDSTGAMDLERAARHPAAPVVADVVQQHRVQAELAEAQRNGSILSGDGTMWQQLGQPHEYVVDKFFARQDCSPAAQSTTPTVR